MGMPPKGLSAGSPSAIPRCYGLPAVNVGRVTPTQVLMTAPESNLGGRVLTKLANIGGFEVVEISALADDTSCVPIAVHLAAGDHDARARRRESVTTGVASLLEIAQQHRVEHLVLVSSAMVYGAWANNPVPLTEDAALRPDLDFVFARQLASVEQMVDDWRTSAPGRTVTVLRPVVTMPPMAPPAWPVRSPRGWANVRARTIRVPSSCTSTISPPR